MKKWAMGAMALLLLGAGCTTTTSIGSSSSSSLTGNDAYDPYFAAVKKQWDGNFVSGVQTNNCSKLMIVMASDISLSQADCDAIRAKYQNGKALPSIDWKLSGYDKDLQEVTIFDTNSQKVATFTYDHDYGMWYVSKKFW